MEVAVDTLVGWLAAMPPPDLAVLIGRRPDVLAEEPADITDLAEALHSPGSLRLLVRRLNRPQLQVLTALAALGEHVAVADLAEILGRATDDQELLLVLVQLAELAAIVVGDDCVHAPADLRRVIPHPLRLGAPAVSLLNGLPVDSVRRIANRLGIPAPAPKGEAIEAIAAWFRDPARVRRVFAKAPAEDREALEAVAWSGPAISLATDGGFYAGRLPSHLVWAVDRGLLMRQSAWALELEMPAEVGLALRGTDWRAPFDPRPPAITTTAVASATIEHEAGAAAATALDQVAAVLAACEQAPVGLRKTGGVAVREVKRLAKAVELEATVVEFWLTVGVAAGLLAPEDNALLATDAYDQWTSSAPANRLAALIWHWWTLPIAPTYQPPAESRDRPEVAVLGGGPRRLRGALLSTLAGYANGETVDVASLLTSTGWRTPFAIDGTADPRGVAQSILAEAATLGLVAHGAASSVARALIAAPADEDSPTDAVATALVEILPALTAYAIFQADLTALVPGVPAASVAALLNACAARESRGQAGTWRFTPASVRGALDAGWAPAALTDALTAVARGGELPQPLRYLIGDIGRQHGRIQVRAVGCLLTTADEALAAEIVAVTGLRRLGLALITASVVTAATDPATTLAALRAAGYAPMGLDAAGHTVIERIESRRVAPDPLGEAMATWMARDGMAREWTARAAFAAVAGESQDDVEREGALAVATRLLARTRRSRPTVEQAVDDDVVVRGIQWGAPRQFDLAHRMAAPPDPRLAVELGAGRLAPRERKLLVNALADAGVVRISYQDSGGTRTTRLIEPTEVLGRMLVAYCHLRQEERHFSLDRITSVRTGPG